MSVNVTVGSGQGITQAIKSKLEADGVKLKNVKLTDWQKVMELVNKNQQQIDKYNAANPNAKLESIFTGGNDASKIANKQNWKTDFKVNAGQTMQIDSGIFAQIKAILSGQSVNDISHEAPKPLKDEKPHGSIVKDENIKHHETLPENINLASDKQKAITENQVDNFGGKVIKREVNGEKQDIAVVNIDGQKVRREVKEDGTLGDTLVPVSTLGKNKYITQTEMDERIKNVFPEGLPDGVTASYVSIGGTPTLVFKKDGKTLDQAQLRELVKNNNDVSMTPEAKQTVVTSNENTQQTPETYNYDNDSLYKQMSETLEKLKSNISDFEKQNNITKDDPFSESDAMFAEGYSDYSSNKFLYGSIKKDYDSYKKIMDNWKNGSKSKDYSANRNVNGRNILSVNYTNIECITLKNGQRAYKTDQGTFYPYNDGNPGNKPVPEDLL